MTISDCFKEYNGADVLFDPTPSYGGMWFFDVNNLRSLSRIENSVNLFEEFLNKYYTKPLRNIFNTDFIKNFKIGMDSIPNSNNIGRSLLFSKYTFFENIVYFLDQKIDRKGKDSEEYLKQLTELANLIDGDNETRNMAFSEALKAKASRLRNLKVNQINSEYFEAAMEDYNAFKEQMTFTEYIDYIYNATVSLQNGMIKLGDFFDIKVDYHEMCSAFDPDIFYLLFAKIIYEFNLQKEKKIGYLDGSCHYLYVYDQILSDPSKIEKRYNPKIFYKHSSGQRELVSRYQIQQSYRELLERHPEVQPLILPELPTDSEKYKNIDLMNKIGEATNSGTAAWEFLPKGERIKRGEVSNVGSVSGTRQKKDKSKLIEDVNMRIDILEKSGYVISPIMGLATFSGYYAFVYPNGKVILEKFWENVETQNPAVDSATYVMSIDNFVELSRMPKLALIEYIKSFPEVGVRRIFHTSIDNWQRNLYNEINGSYRFEDAIDFINNLKNGVISNEQ